MAKYKCSVCGYIYDEEKEGKPFSELTECPVCKQPVSEFHKVEDDNPVVRNYRYMKEIQQMAATGEPIIEAMGTGMPMPGWDDILILGAQLNPAPLDEHADVDITTVIGKHAKKPMVLSGPVYISHMSFGALSKEAKVALAKGSAMAKTAMCSGEGGILPEEMEAAHKYIFEYVPNLYSVTPENLKNADAIEIKIGQGTKPGMGGHLPGEKVTPDIARIRNKPLGKDVISPSKFSFINSKEDLKEVVEGLRIGSEGRPIGIKIAAGHIERDLWTGSLSRTSAASTATESSFLTTSRSPRVRARFSASRVSPEAVSASCLNPSQDFSISTAARLCTTTPRPAARTTCATRRLCRSASSACACRSSPRTDSAWDSSATWI